MCDKDIHNDLIQFVLNTISIQVGEKSCKFVHFQKTIFRVKIYMKKLLVYQLRMFKMVLSEIKTWCQFVLLNLLVNVSQIRKMYKWNEAQLNLFELQWIMLKVEIQYVTYANTEEMARTKIKYMYLIAETIKKNIFPVE